MAGDWIKVEVATSQKIEVFLIAEILDMDIDTVLGKLIRLWSWADANTIDGHAKSVTKKLLDRVVGCDGFVSALLDERVNWLCQLENGDLFFINFDRHNGKGAKKRATDAARQAKKRVTDTVAKQSRSNRDNSVTREEKRREDLKDKDPPLTPPKKEKPVYEYPPGLNVAAWDEWKQYRKDLKIKAYAPTPRSEGAAITNLLKLSGGDLQKQAEIIRQSMVNSWHGLFEIKTGGNHEASGRYSAGDSFKGNAVEAVHAATARMREQHGLASPGQNNQDLGSHGGTLFGQMDTPERANSAITLDQRDWKTV